MNTNNFKTEIFGFKKNDVYEHVENLYKSFDEQLRQKDQEISHINKDNIILKEQISKLEDKFAGLDDYKANIADVLLKAKEQAEEILTEAKNNAEEIKRQTDEYVSAQKLKLEQFKQEINLLKQKSIEIINKYNNELQDIIDDDIIEESLEEDIKENIEED